MVRITALVNCPSRYGKKILKATKKPARRIIAFKKYSLGELEGGTIIKTKTNKITRDRTPL
jgi:hypothetical protein